MLEADAAFVHKGIFCKEKLMHVSRETLRLHNFSTTKCGSKMFHVKHYLVKKRETFSMMKDISK